ncbi:MAG: methyltransferase domain-containing protein [Gammaproteobacteria bacterium]|nr:MAG: methyltransferase domain-containing protein [Gammaproteobacteria bacterium]
MALICPANFDAQFLREQVQATYEAVASNPDGDFHFHRGAEYAAKYLGYDYDELMQLPATATARFAGVGNPVQIGDMDPSLGAIRPGQVVLDHACGAGMDLLLAARRVGDSGKAIGVDLTPGMRASARKAAEEAGLAHIVDIREGVYENLPVADASIDVVISNGVVNLAPDKLQVFREMARVLKPGGHLFLADVVVQRELTLDARSNPVLWAACVGGALVESELLTLAKETGLVNGNVTKRFNCFFNTTAEQKVAKDLFVHAVNFVATKPIN